MAAMDEAEARENVLDHYRSPRNYGELEQPDATAEGHNPLCGDEQTVELRLRDGIVEDIRFRGNGCSISKAATSMLSEVVVGRPAQEVAALSKTDVTDLLGIPLSPVRLKCALLGLGTIKVALNRSLGTALPEGWEGLSEITWG
jgi:nitrogen fixation NifU-like protein